MPARATITVVSAVVDIGLTTEATATSNYVEVDVVAYIDTSSDNQWAYETVPLGDVRFNLLEKNLADLTTLGDAPTWQYFKNKTETLVFSEEFARVVAYQRDFNDAFTLDDLSQIDKDFYGNKGNIFGFTDIVGLTHQKVLTDDYTVGDVFTKVIEFYRDFSETLALSEEREFEVLKTEGDNLSMGSLPMLGVTLSKEDTYTVGDTSFNSLVKNLVDAFALDDSALVDKDFFGSKGNVLGLSEIFVRAVDYIRIHSDSIAISDSSVVEPLLQKEDSVSFSEVVLIGWFYERVLYDFVRVHDIIPSTLGANSFNSTTLNTDETNIRTFIDPGVVDSLGFSELQVSSVNKILTDTFALDDSTLVDKDFYGNKGNVFTFSEVFSMAVGFERGFEDSYNFLDVYAFNFSKSLEDSSTVTDINVFTFDKGVSDAYSLSEETIFNLEKTVNDGIGLDDSALVDKNYFGNKGNIMSISDVVVVDLVVSNAINSSAFNTRSFN